MLGNTSAQAGHLFIVGLKTLMPTQHSSLFNIEHNLMQSMKLPTQHGMKAFKAITLSVLIFELCAECIQ